jgi:hypothetical protein
MILFVNFFPILSRDCFAPLQVLDVYIVHRFPLFFAIIAGLIAEYIDLSAWALFRLLVLYTCMSIFIDDLFVPIANRAARD